MTFGRVPPLTTPTLTVMPRFEIVQPFQGRNHVGKLTNGAAAVLRPRTGMGGHALDENLEPTDALASGDDLAAVAGGLGHQHIFGLLPFGFDQRARGRAADLLVGNVELGHAERRTGAHRSKLPEGVVGQIGTALHVVDAGAEGAVSLDPERKALDEAHRMHGIEVA